MITTAPLFLSAEYASRHPVREYFEHPWGGHVPVTSGIEITYNNAGTAVLRSSSASPHLLPDGFPKAVGLHELRQPCNFRELFEEHHTLFRVNSAQLAHEVHRPVAVFPELAGPGNLGRDKKNGATAVGVWLCPRHHSSKHGATKLRNKHSDAVPNAHLRRCPKTITGVHLNDQN